MPGGSRGEPTPPTSVSIRWKHHHKGVERLVVHPIENPHLVGFFYVIYYICC